MNKQNKKNKARKKLEKISKVYGGEWISLVEHKKELERARLEGEIKGVDCAIGELRSEAFENYWKLPSRLSEYVGKLEQRLSKLSRIESSLEM